MTIPASKTPETVSASHSSELFELGTLRDAHMVSEHFPEWQDVVQKYPKQTEETLQISERNPGPFILQVRAETRHYTPVLAFHRMLGRQTLAFYLFDDARFKNMQIHLWSSRFVKAQYRDARIEENIHDAATGAIFKLIKDPYETLFYLAGCADRCRRHLEKSAFNMLRNAARRKRFLSDNDATSQQADKRSGMSAQELDLHSDLEKILTDEIERRVFLLRRVDDLDISVIAATLELSPATVYRRLDKAERKVVAWLNRPTEPTVEKPETESRLPSLRSVKS
jgi:hypothetical protein